MNIIRKSPDKYGLQMVGKKCHRIVKILKEYENEQQAVNDLTRLLVGETTEKDLTGSSFEQDVEVGKLGNRINVLEAALVDIRDSLIDSLVLSAGDVEKAAREAVKKINDLVDGGTEG